MTRVLIAPIRKHKNSNIIGEWYKASAWTVIDAVTNKCLFTDRSMSECIYKIEQEGYILEPTI